jgi:putative ABC transport system permease protein
MYLKMLKKDALKKKMITVALFIFISLSVLLVASGTNMVMELTNSMNALFTKSNAPHFVQMHSGNINQAEIDTFASRNSLVKDSQTVEMINIDGSSITLGNSQTSEQISIMDHYFVKQNHSFDFLLDLESEVIQVSKGEIAVPIYFKQQSNLNIGDKVRIANQSFDMELTVVNFVRDVQMNPPIIHSKRFLVNEDDLDMLKKNIGEVEYLIEFQLADLSKLSEFRNTYQSFELPNKGPNIDYNLFKTLNAITDGVVAAVIILVSVLLTIIAILCIRFTILAAIEEDYREIGVMKAIGIGQKDIKKIYLLKYIIMAALASVIGYLVSLFLGQLFTSNIQLYLGTAPKSILLHIVPFIAVLFIFLIVVLYCMFILRRFNKITAVEALRSGNMGETQLNKKYLSLGKSKFFNVHFFLGLREVFGRFKMYRLLFFVFFVCTFIIIIPVNFLNTINSPSFISYMGIERSDIRIDLQQSDHIVEDFNRMITYIENDQDIERFSPLVTSQYTFINHEGAEEKITVETGDFSKFPLEYLEGRHPINENEIALSYLNAKELEKSVGDHLQFVMNGEEKGMVVSGIYQDVTNGGRTAKGLLPINQETVLWYEVALNIKSHSNIDEKIDEYSKVLYPAKVTDLEGYLSNTLGNTIEQLRLITILAIVIALCIAILITTLFLRMLIAKDYSQIAILKSIGFSLSDIRIQYVTRTLLILNLAIILGTIFSNTVGQSIVSGLLSFMGASKISFVIDPIQAYVFCPIILMIIVTITTLMSIVSIKKSSIAEMIVE